jgi:ribosome biogenesis GTPase
LFNNTGLHAIFNAAAHNSFIQMSLLHQYGWNDFHLQQIEQHKEHLKGRVVAIQGFKYHLITVQGELEAELSGRLLFGADPESLPKVGDWVSYLDYETMGYIIAVMPRRSVLSRKNAGSEFSAQILATNIDCAFVVQGLDSNFNIMRLERYLTQLAACGLKTVVVLNKADLVNDFEKYRTQVTSLQRNCLVVFCSSLTGQGLEELGLQFEPAKTYVLIGSSGVGKSSIVNRLAANPQQLIQSVSDFNNKGKHTTTTRELFLLPNGSLLIDTPGMREFGLTNENDEQAGTLFPAIAKHAIHCRYSDCNHLASANGCAVIQAVLNQELDHVVYDSYLKLVKEQKRFEIKIEDQKRLGKQFGKLTREAKNHRKKYKY